MPVGSADKGVGLGAGEIMFTGDYIYQSIDWWHGIIPLPSPENPDEPYEHYGLLNSNILNLGLTIGLNDYWNISLSQLLVERCMEWQARDPETGDLEPSVHHRTECSSSDFDNSKGGYLGDTRLNFKYLLSNQGKGPGNRVFIGGGFVIPSNNVLTRSPFLTYEDDNNDSHYPDHRHFSLSDGSYKIFTDFQFFKKRMKLPVFWGTTFSIEYPLNESKYGFYPSKVYDLSMMAISGPVNIKTNFIKISSIGLNFSIKHTTESKWDDIIAPNSKSTTYIPGLSVLFMSKIGTFGVNIQKPYMDNLATNDGGVEQNSEIWQFSISYRKILDKYIDKLYWK